MLVSKRWREKKILLMATLLIGAINYAAEGMNLPFTTDGKLHEEKLINRNIHSEDTDIRIKKIGKGKYEITGYYESQDEDFGEVETSVIVSEATLKKNVICDENVCIGYDTKLKKAVFLDKDDMKIIYPEW